eukprot:TRINITY_DN2585_c0_g1_i1.p1 TRINITY_DN2585_c0_g1~~TRINITY_DN2585_c0_g1_i1.p1  ORF type:complete len:540 (-),score=125.46 TRINITY_DN2585_c0_g1_i1:414-2033(-)
MAEKLKQLRAILRNKKVKAFLIPTNDSHQSEYVGKSDKRREFISHFTGSAGTALCFDSDDKKAVLFTDSRYHLQCEEQVDSSIWKVMKVGNEGVKTCREFIKDNFTEGDQIGLDPETITASTVKSLNEFFKTSGIRLMPFDENPVDLIWTDRPEKANSTVEILPDEFNGESAKEKIDKIRTEMAKEKADVMVVSALDEVAWLLNIRGTDIEYCPVNLAHVILTQEKLAIFINEKKLTEEVLEYFTKIGVSDVLPYDNFLDALEEFSTTTSRVWVNENYFSWAQELKLKDATILTKMSPIQLLKAVKNSTELNGLAECHRDDAVSLLKWMVWLEKELKPGHSHTELSIGKKLDELRSENKHFKGLSFPSIVCTGMNGADIHHEPTDAAIDENAPLLCDSGGQYLSGTTDVTRTFVPAGSASAKAADEWFKKCFTLVLKGHLAVQNAVFPNKTPGGRLDTLARQFLWEFGLDFGHGTGHGVGSFLNVHEGPIGISFRESSMKVGLEPGMVLTDEPGYYEKGNFGIRIENELFLEKVSLSDI